MRRSRTDEQALESSIEKLKEYRASLIDSVVTGKVKVSP
jgi:hypothetical protein